MIKLPEIITHLIQCIGGGDLTNNNSPSEPSKEQQPKINVPKYVYFFEEGGKSLIDLLGGKGAVLGEMTKLGMPVPPGFTITTAACKEYQEKGNLPDNVKSEMENAIPKLENTTGKKFGGKKNPLFVSVRSGAKISMPGMMDTILNIGLNDKTVESLAKETGNEEFAYSSYKRLIEMFADVVFGIPLKDVKDYLSNSEAIAKSTGSLLLEHALQDQKFAEKAKKNITKRILEEAADFDDSFVSKLKEIDALPDYSLWLDKAKEAVQEIKIKKEITDPNEIRKKAKEGMEVEIKKEGIAIKGVIKKIDPNFIGVECKESIPGGHNLGGSAKDKHGWWANYDSVKLFSGTSEEQKKVLDAILDYISKIKLNDYHYNDSKNFHAKKFDYKPITDTGTPTNVSLVRGVNFDAITVEEEHKLVLELLNEKNPKIEAELLKHYLKSRGKEFPQEVNEQLLSAINAVFGSWNNKRAVEYRRLNNIPEDIGTAANVQSMVFGNMGNDSATGVAFSRRPTDGKKELYGEFLPNAQGEDVVAGIRTPIGLSLLKESHPQAYKELEKLAENLELHFRDMQDIEFTIEKGKLWILQARNGKRTALAALSIASDMANEGIISMEEALLRVDPFSLEAICTEAIDPDSEYDVLAKGAGASPGIVSGIIALTPEKAKEYAKEKKECILVRSETSPDDIEGIAASVGIITKTGGATSHAALVTRAMNKACITGCGDIEIYNNKIMIKGKEFYEGEAISIDGTTGEVIKGEVKVVRNDKNPKLERLVEWAYQLTKKDFAVIADTPKDIEQAFRDGAKEIGLCRTEHLFFLGEDLSLVRDYMVAENNDERKAALKKLKKSHQKAFDGIFKALGDKKIRVRLLCCSLDEFLPSDKELGYMKRMLASTKEAEEKPKGSKKKSKLEVGDKVVVNKNGNNGYTLTKEGSEGEITGISPRAYEIKFSKLTGGDHETPYNFVIDKDCVDTLEEEGSLGILQTLIETTMDCARAHIGEAEKNKKLAKCTMLENRINSPSKCTYNDAEMEGIYTMQVEAIKKAYAKADSNAEVEILMPEIIPENNRIALRDKLQKIIEGHKGISLNPNAGSIYFAKNIEGMKGDIGKAYEAEAIALRPKHAKAAQLLLARYVIKNGREK